MGKRVKRKKELAAVKTLGFEMILQNIKIKNYRITNQISKENLST